MPKSSTRPVVSAEHQLVTDIQTLTDTRRQLIPQRYSVVKKRKSECMHSSLRT